MLMYYNLDLPKETVHTIRNKAMEGFSLPTKIDNSNKGMGVHALIICI